ncbi:MAG: GlsB/YeaQ/YmgE family stress response membrane protein [Phycisphaerae bacterium]|nr:GlsB/YeaQ/YmgE family stress response membrane protein [Phycisphaerae bacterium]
MHFVYIILIGAFAGYVAGRITRGRGFGFLGNLVVGVVGAMVGGLLFDITGIEATNMLGRLVMAVVGALLLLLVMDRLTRKKRRRS